MDQGTHSTANEGYQWTQDHETQCSFPVPYHPESYNPTEKWNRLLKVQRKHQFGEMPSKEWAPASRIHCKSTIITQCAAPVVRIQGARSAGVEVGKVMIASLPVIHWGIFPSHACNPGLYVFRDPGHRVTCCLKSSRVRWRFLNSTWFSAVDDITLLQSFTLWVFYCSFP